MPDMLEIVPGDPVERHILITNTHDMSGPWEAVFVNWRPLSGSVVQSPVEGLHGRVRIRHTKNNPEAYLRTILQNLVRDVIRTQKGAIA